MRAKEARDIQIVDYLSSFGIEPKKREHEGKTLWYSSPLREGDKHPSFKVDTYKNLWFDFGMAKGGNVIDLVCELHNASVKEALALLHNSGLYLGSDRVCSSAVVSNQTSLVGNAGQEIKKFAGEKEKISVFEVLGVSNIINDGLIQLLNERKIDRAVAEKYLKQIHYKPRGNAKSYYALAWACGDGYEARSRFFKGFIGTRKDLITINLKEGQHLKDGQSLSVFEGFFDFLAFLTAHKMTDFQNSVIILNTINLRKRALEVIRQFRFSKVYLFLDNDKAGDATKDFFKLGIDEVPVIDKSSLYSGYNDFNEMLIKEA